MARKEQRRRVSAEDTRNNAREGSGSKVFFRLPKEIRQWEPKKANTYNIDMLPYLITSKAHPDRYEPGCLWYKLPFLTFRSVGTSGLTIVSPATFGQPCPLMEERTRLAADYEKNKVQIAALGLQKWTAFCIIDPDDKTKVAVFAISHGKFFGAKAGLEKEILEAVGDDNLNFWDVTAGGRTLVCRFSDMVFDGSNYVECTRIDFKPRPAMDEDATLARVPDLDAALEAMILPYDKLKKMMHALDGPTAAKPVASTVVDTTAAAPVAQTPAAKNAPVWKDGDRVTWEKGTLVGTVDDVDDDDITVKGDDGKEYEIDASDLEAYVVPTTSAAPAGGAFVVGQEVQNDDGSFHGTITKIKDNKATVKDAGGTKRVFDFDDDDLEPYKPVPVAAPVAPTGDIVVGMFVKDTSDDTTGTVMKIDGDDVTLRDAKGALSIVDLDDLVPAGGTAGVAPVTADMTSFKIGDAVTWDDGDEEGVIVKFATKGDKVTVKDAAGVEHKLPVTEIVRGVVAPEAAPALATPKPLVVGGKCSWDDGDEEGFVVKIKPDKIKVKGGDGESWQPVADVVAM